MTPSNPNRPRCPICGKKDRVRWQPRTMTYKCWHVGCKTQFTKKGTVLNTEWMPIEIRPVIEAMTGPEPLGMRAFHRQHL